MRSGGGRSVFVFLSAAIVGALTLGLTACAGDAPGGGDEAAFERDFNAATQTYQSELAAVQEQGQSVTATDPKQVAGVFEELRGLAQRTHDSYGDLNPPTEVAAAHAALLENLEKQSDALGRIAAGTRAEAPDTEALTELATLLGEFAAAQQALAQQLAQEG